MHPPSLTEAEAAVRLALALLLGVAVGVERQRGERAAGMRTFALVCFGSALITLVSAYGFTEFMKYSATVRMDPGRIAAQIVSGIGFLGAGTIIFRREIVQGLTTAAGLWVAAGIGMAAGAGLYFVAIASTVGAIVILAVLKQIERRFFPSKRYLIVRARSVDGQMATIRAAFRQSGVRLTALTIRPGEAGEDVLQIQCLSPAPSQMDLLFDRLRAIPGIAAIEAARGAGIWREEEEEQ